MVLPFWADPLPWYWGDCYRLAPVETFKIMQSTWKPGGLLAVSHARWTSVEEIWPQAAGDWWAAHFGAMLDPDAGQGFFLRTSPWWQIFLSFNCFTLTLESQALQSSEMSNIRPFGHFNSALFCQGMADTLITQNCLVSVWYYSTQGMLEGFAWRLLLSL